MGAEPKRGLSKSAAELGRATSAYAVQGHVVLLDSKSRRREIAEIVQAPRDIKSSIALLALKMVMMSLVCALVSCGFPGDFHEFDPAII